MNSALPPGTQDTPATARPWTSGSFQVYGADHSRVAHTGAGQHRTPEALANAKLIVEAVNAYEPNKALIEQLYAKTTCCCGDAADHSAMGAGHSPVPMYDYALMNAKKRAAELEQALWLFREFVNRWAGQWTLGAGSHHHPMWALIAETLGEKNNENLVGGTDWRFIQPENQLSREQIASGK